MSSALGQSCPDVFEHSITPDDNRSHVTFIKLLLLVLFHHHISRLSSICRNTFPSPSHLMLYKTISRIRNCTEFYQHVCQLINIAEFTCQNLEIEQEPLGSSPKSLMEYILEIRYSSAQLTQLSKANTERYQHGWDAYRELQNEHGSQGIKRLTVLATVFLPLSLASSMLAMTTRLADLGLILFDFVGVFFFIASMAFVLYLIIVIGNNLVIFARKRKLSAAILENSGSRKVTAVPYLRLLRVGCMVFLGIAWIGTTITMFVGGMFPHTRPALYHFKLWPVIIVAIIVVLYMVYILAHLLEPKLLRMSNRWTSEDRERK